MKSGAWASCFVWEAGSHGRWRGGTHGGGGGGEGRSLGAHPAVVRAGGGVGVQDLAGEPYAGQSGGEDHVEGPSPLLTCYTASTRSRNSRYRRSATRSDSVSGLSLC